MSSKIRQIVLLVLLAALIFATGSAKAMSNFQKVFTPTPGEVLPTATATNPAPTVMPTQTSVLTLTLQPNPMASATPAINPLNTVGLEAAVNPPSAPSLVLPVNEVSTIDLRPLLDWTNSTVPAGTTFKNYELQLAVVNTFPAPTIVNLSGAATKSEFTPNWNLNPNKQYYWRVRANNSLGEASPWSSVGTFHTAPLAPTLISPNNDAVLLNNIPVFDWSDVSGVTGYRLQISQTSAFTILMTNITLASSAYTPTANLPENTILYWRVQSQSVNGESLPSAVQTLKTANLSQATSTSEPTGVSPTATPTQTSLPPALTPTPTNTSIPATSTPKPTPVQTGRVYYIANSGNNANPGTLPQPWLTIQKCLDQVQPGDTCQILGGTYPEALVLKNSGTQAARITLKNYNAQMVTVNSGNGKTIVTGRRIDYYTIEGLRLIASFTPVDQSDVSIELAKNIPFTVTSTTGGNHGFIFRNCYIEGAIHFYGHSNLVENCELNGKNIYKNALMDNYVASYDNIFRNNNIHHYGIRGVWSMNATNNLLIEGNTIHDVQFGIDCDGAAVPVSNCKIVGNQIYATGVGQWGGAIYLENCFSCLVTGNTIHDLQKGPSVYVLNYGNGDSTGWHTYNNVEYRNRASNTRITDNLFYNYQASAAIYVTSVNGLVINQNTFYTLSGYPAIGLHSEKDAAGILYAPKDETITNNIFFGIGVKWFNPTTGLVSAGNFTGDPGFVNLPVDFHLKTNSPACTAGIGGKYSGVFPCQ